jgi:hypothetical protein
MIECNDILNWSECNSLMHTEADNGCVWVNEEETRCQRVEKSCEIIAKENICKTQGASFSGLCIWVEESGSKTYGHCTEDPCSDLYEQQHVLEDGSCTNNRCRFVKPVIFFFTTMKFNVYIYIIICLLERIRIVVFVFLMNAHFFRWMIVCSMILKVFIYIC